MRRRRGWGWLFFWPLAPLLVIAPFLWWPVVAGVTAFWLIVLVMRAVKKGVTGK